jgi:hypothetical protein
MGSKNTKEKKEEPKELETTVQKIIDEQTIYTRDDCTSGESCVKFSNKKYYKKYNNVFLKEYGYNMLFIIFFLLLFMLLYNISRYKKNTYK